MKSGSTDYNIDGNSLIDVYAKGGNIEAVIKLLYGNEALLVFQDMLAAEERPNHVPFVGVLSAFANLVRWDAAAWHTLLNACHVHRNYDLGKQIAEPALEMDPSDVGTFTLLSNMYAEAERWDSVVKIWKLMRERNIKEEPGLSWIETKNATYVFVSVDSTHPEHTQIY
ncbi:hypothetical protein K2173_020033 [Erythroxylum novogranatense]|uniref:Pentatricopeptide repeat-containing protein n=1 Tax=Erythroxylum novogranatense TaxID=1862640 RepID=A0AAV8UA28_9ROSI|nr:hypothetical protein K2173_020033 [Erythroxylum novogranatense]